MLLIALLILAVAWVAVLALVLGVCVSAARSDRELLGEPAERTPPRTGGRTALRLVTPVG